MVGNAGGCGLGLGYLTPVSTLIAWFPDRRGMATGMAIMGFGGGALVASPLSVLLMKTLSSETSTGVAETWVVLGVAYLICMTIGAFGYRLPAPGWKPAGWTPAPAKAGSLITKHDVTPGQAIATPQFKAVFTKIAAERGQTYDEHIAERTSHYPIPRMGTPEDMAAAAIYLASRAGDYVVGDTIAVDGGVALADLPARGISGDPA